MSQPFVGEIRMFAGNFAPAGWMFCDGSLLSISQFSVLFNLIGTTYGGDGQSTFALPDLRGRLPVHAGNGFVIAQSGGVETVTLSLAQMPVHSHSARSSSAGAVSRDPAGNVWAAWNSNQFSDQPADGVMNASAIGGSGGDQPHENMVPFLAVNFIISLFGIFPSQA